VQFTLVQQGESLLVVWCVAHGVGFGKLGSLVLHVWNNPVDETSTLVRWRWQAVEVPGDGLILVAER